MRAPQLLIRDSTSLTPHRTPAVPVGLRWTQARRARVPCRSVPRKESRKVELGGSQWWYGGKKPSRIAGAASTHVDRRLSGSTCVQAEQSCKSFNHLLLGTHICKHARAFQLPLRTTHGLASSFKSVHRPSRLIVPVSDSEDLY